MKWDMPIRPIESGPLTDRETGELDAFLLAEDGLENPMDFYTSRRDALDCSPAPRQRARKLKKRRR